MCLITLIRSGNTQGLSSEEQRSEVFFHANLLGFSPLSKAVLPEEMLCIFSACPAFASAIVCVQLQLSSFTAVSGGDCSMGLGLGICA